MRTSWRARGSRKPRSWPPRRQEPRCARSAMTSCARRIASASSSRAGSPRNPPTMGRRRRRPWPKPASRPPMLDSPRRGASLNVVRAQIEKMRIRAPFDGTVLEKNAELGEIVGPAFGGSSSSGGGVPVVTMADLASVEVEVDVNETYVRRVTPGMPAEITLDAYPDQTYEGSVRQIVPTADRQRATVQVKVAFAKPDARVLPEMGARVSFLAPEVETAGAGGFGSRATGSTDCRARDAGMGAEGCDPPRGRCDRGLSSARRSRRRGHRRDRSPAGGRSAGSRRTRARGASGRGRSARPCPRKAGPSQERSDHRSRSGTTFIDSSRREDGRAACRAEGRHQGVLPGQPRGPGPRGNRLRGGEGRLLRPHGALGLGQDDAPEPDRRHRRGRPRARWWSPGRTSASSTGGSWPSCGRGTSASSSSSTT